MKEVLIARFIRRIALTQDAELDCGECAQLSPQYVDAVMDGHDGLDHWAMVRAHLEQCTVCAQEFVTLRDAVKMDLDGTWPPEVKLLEWACRRDLSA